MAHQFGHFDFLQDFFEETDLGRRTLFESFLPQDVFGQRRQQLSGLFQPTFNKFLSGVGGHIRSGQDPTRTFAQSLESFDPQRELLRQPSFSGSGGSQLTTPTIHNF